MTENIYAPPLSALEPTEADKIQFPIHLASRWARLGAVIIDGIILGIAGAGIGFLLSLLGSNFNLGSVFEKFFWADVEDETFMLSFLSTALDVAIYLAINTYFLVKSGQTIGKKALGIQVVSRDTHQLLSSGKIIGIRYILTEFLYIVPAIGSLFALVDTLSIFGAEKRCIHDLMAGSIVIKSTSRTHTEK